MTSRLTYSAVVVFSLAFLVCLMAAGAPVASLAAECGDDVGGARVACECGDIVVSDTRLQPQDPIVRLRCDHDGLSLRAPRGAASIGVDLAGLSIVGSGSGSGIRILDGGENGAVIIGGEPGRPGEIAGFRNGVRATGSRPLAEIRDLGIKGSTSDGLILRGLETRLIRVASDDNARDGLRVGGHGHTLEGVEAARNAGYGLRMMARDAEGEASAADNARGAVMTPACGTKAKVEVEDQLR